MTNQVVCGAYWGDRAESVDSCVQRLTKCLDSVREIDARFGTWYLKKASRKAGLGAPIAHAPESLRELLLAGRNRRDFGGTVIEELGFSLSAWNGDYDRSASLSVFCGAHAGIAGLVNSFVISMPDSLEELVDAMDGARARRLVTAIVSAWHPDWASIITDAMRDLQRPLPRQPVVGLATYLSGARHVARAKLPTGVLVEALPGGTLLLLDRDPQETLADRTLTLSRELGDAIRPVPIVAAE